MAVSVADLGVEPRFGWVTMGDGTRLRTAHWTATATPPRGTALLLTGRAEFIEKYAETAGELLARGFDVFAFDWRNQGLSDRPLPNRQIHHLDSFDTLAGDLDEVVEQLVRPRRHGPLLLVAHSMGGLVALMALLRNPALCDAAVLTAPMFDIFTGPVPRRMAVWLAERLCARGRAAEYAFGQHDYDPVEGLFTPVNPITADPRRYATYHDAFRDRPELRVGGVSFGWVRAALRAADHIRFTAALERVTTPILLLSAPADAVVRSESHRLAAARLGNAVLKEHPDAKHELLMERDDIRDRVWADIDAFLAALHL
ncbi:alpha/beta hydrolase [Azospirillum sp. YIM DDC1]|uniref:Alpha/beta hydrolase n=1 Tax=Azospirillum aestuarii TaxID=2802052 RepID=A0ABS1I2N4_9PROT|nr:alpha/beta hydrolase [Azospirillum aestuarii]MBK3775023.1 alpha/beta fold hydrolase [Azospirillum brasilense]MBK4721338.1 alpha/beta hydrolase [Azospirillum aestuarii]TWA86984.1 lysophospholipase [Azospirillum brasilense]